MINPPAPSATAIDGGRDTVPTSAAQDALLFATHLYPRRPVLATSWRYHLEGQVDDAALRAAWLGTLARHDALRVREVGLGRQHLGPPSIESFRLVDARAADPATAVAEAGPAGVDNNGTGPLARLTVVRTGESSRELVLAAHRLIADEPSIAVILADLSAGYAELTSGGPRPDPPTPLSDGIGRQRHRAATQRGGPQERWWADALAGPLPAAGPCPVTDLAVGPSADADAVQIGWDPAASTAIAALARAEGVGPAEMMIAALQVLAGRHGDPAGAVVGLIGDGLSTRPPALVGQFGTVLPVPSQLAGVGTPGRLTFAELLRRVTRAVALARCAADVPFARIVELVAPDRRGTGTPLCPVTLIDPAWGAAPGFSLAGAFVFPAGSDEGALLCDIAVRVDRWGHSPRATLRFRTAAVHRSSAVELGEQLRALLAAGAARPDHLVADLPLETPERIAVALAGAGAEDTTTGAGGEPGHGVDELVRLRAERQPDATAVRHGGHCVTYRELWRRAEIAADTLTAELDLTGRPVLIRCAAGANQLVASLAVLRAGGHFSWSGPGRLDQRSKDLVDGLRPVCVLTDGDPGRDPVAGWYRDLVVGPVRDVEALVIGDEKDRSLPARQDSARSAAYVAFTSGSTGRPKAVRHDHGALAQFAGWFAGATGIGPGARVAQWVAPEHDPSLCEVFATLVSGGTLCPVPDATTRLHPERFVDWLDTERITVLQTIPSFARELLPVLARREPAGLPSLTCLVLMGEALPGTLATGLFSVLPGTRLLNVYGPTETVAGTWHEITGPVDGEPAPIGRPIPGRQVLVVDEEDRLCPPGVAGEIVIRSRYAISGYHSDDGAEPGPAFRPLRRHPTPAGLRTYRTGDRGRRSPDGTLDYVGRLDRQIKLGGNRIELDAVEATLTAHLAVREAAVVPVTGPDGLITRLSAHVVPAADGPPATTALRDLLRAQLGPAAARMVIYHHQDLPRHPTGKIDRSKLSDGEWDEQDEQDERRGRGERGEQPLTEPERRLADLWGDLVATTPTRPDQDFFATGGTSLLLVRLAGAITEHLGVDVPLPRLLAEPTLAGMATSLTRAGADRRHAPSWRAADEPRPPRHERDE